MGTNGQEDYSKRDHIHINANPYRLQTVLWAPEKGSNQARFAIEVMIYVAGMGWDAVDPMTQGNKLMIMFRDKVRMNELWGYKHIGKSSDELTEMYKNLWGVDKI